MTALDDGQERADWRSCWAQEFGAPPEFVRTEADFQKLLDFILRQP